MTTVPPGPAYRVRTRRLTLRCWAPADAPSLSRATTSSLEHLRPWMPWARNFDQGVESQLALLRRFRGDFDHGRDYHYGVFDRETGLEVWGGTGLHTTAGPDARAIGYWLRGDKVGQGLATEIAAALTRVAFAVDNVRRVEIHVDPLNVRSAAVPKRLGFAHEATLRARLPGPDGAARDEMVWTMLASEFRSSPCAAADVEAYDALDRRIL